MNRFEIIESVQQLTTRIIATHREGVGLRLIGGYRYRLIDSSTRLSADLDYHWEGDLRAKRDAIVRLLQVRLLPEVKRKLDLSGSVQAADHPGEYSPFVKTAEIALYHPAQLPGRITIPLDFTRIPCVDPPKAVTVGGCVVLTVSDADLIESKILAVFLRNPIAARDIVDIYLFQNHVSIDVESRLADKCRKLSISPSWMTEAWDRIRKRRGLLTSAIDSVLAEQMAPAVAANLRRAGGAKMMLEEAFALIERSTRKARDTK